MSANWLKAILTRCSIEYGFQPKGADESSNLSRQAQEFSTMESTRAMFGYEFTENFLRCVEIGDLDAVRSFARDHPQLLCMVFDDGQSALHLAVQQNQISMVRLIVNLGTHIDIRNAFGYAPLHVAAKKGLPEIAELLINCGAHAEARAGVAGETPLYFATSRNSKEHARIVRMLLEHGARMDLHSAVSMGDTIAVKELITESRSPIEDAIDRDYLLHSALGLRHRNFPNDQIVLVLKLLLENGANPNHPSDWCPPLLQAVSSSEASTEVIRTLLNHGADPMFQNDHETVLEAAESVAPDEVVRLIRDAVEG